MRYSRFRSQIEPSTAPKRARKKNTKKGEKGDPKGEMPASIPVSMSTQPFSMMPPELVPKAEPSDSNPFVKCEPGDLGFAEIPDYQHHFSMSPHSLSFPSHMSQYVPHGTQFSIAPGASPSLQSFNLTHFENPCSSLAPQNSASMHDFPFQQHLFHNAPVISWEHPAPSNREPTPENIRDEPEVFGKIVFDKAPIKIEP